MIVMVARGYKSDGSGGEVAIYRKWSSRNPLLVLNASKFSCWLFNFYVRERKRLKAIIAAITA